MNDLDLKSKEQNLFKSIFKTVKEDWMLYALLLPMVVWFLWWVYQPMGGLLIAFKSYKPNLGIMESDFVGLYNFKTLTVGVFSDQFWSAFRNTFLISLYGLIFGFPIPILLAILFSEINNKVVLKTTQTIVYLPHFLSEVTITGLVITLLYAGEANTGVIANFLYQIGVIDESVKILTTPSYFRAIYIITGMWKEAGYKSIVYFAAIMGIAPTLYEALRIDGGNKLQELRYVTFPGMAPTLIIMIILRIGSMLSVGYERIILLYNENVYQTADVLSSFVYRVGLEQGLSDLGAAADIFNAVIGFSLVISANIISKQISKTSLW